MSNSYYIIPRISNAMNNWSVLGPGFIYDTLKLLFPGKLRIFFYPFSFPDKMTLISFLHLACPSLPPVAFPLHTLTSPSPPFPYLAFNKNKTHALTNNSRASLLTGIKMARRSPLPARPTTSALKPPGK